MSSSADSFEPQIPWQAITGIIATVTVFAVAQGLTYPLFAFILEKQGVPPGFIGLSAAMTPFGFIVSSWLVPAMTRRFGAAYIAIVCALMAALLLVALGLWQNLWTWMPLRFLLGFFANPLYVISETWLISIAPPAKRGRVMGAYTSIVSGGFAVGPLALSVMGADGWAPFLFGIIGFLSCGAAVLMVIPRLPELAHSDEPMSVGGFVRLAPLLLIAVAVVAAFEHSILSMTAVYGSAFGSTEARISIIIAVFTLGNLALQIPLGRLAERYGALNMMTICAALSLVGAVLLPVLFTNWAIWPMVFVWGSVVFGVYTMALISLGERFSGQLLIAGNAAFSLVWGIGGISGSPATGLLMQAIGPYGLPIALAVMSGALTLLLLMRRKT